LLDPGDDYGHGHAPRGRQLDQVPQRHGVRAAPGQGLGQLTLPGWCPAARHARRATAVDGRDCHMRAIWITKAGGPEVPEVREAPDPEPGPGEVRIRVRAAGLNFADVMARQGLYPDAPKPPCVVGYEVAGEVDAGPPELVGRRVLALTKFGGHADTVCVPAAQVFELPDGLDFEAAAAIPVTYLTAYHMLFRVANVRAGERVLVHMAAGGVGLAVLQLLRT